MPEPADEHQEVALSDDDSLIADAVESVEHTETAAASELESESEPAGDENAADERDEWPVHRPLIRATLPRPEGQTPERKAPDFTFRQSGGRFDSNRNGQRPRGGHRQGRQAHGQSQPGQGGSRFGGPRGQGHGGAPQGQRHGNRPGQGGNRAGQSQGQGRGPRPGGGGGRKRGR
jgi:hypothetical protein